MSIKRHLTDATFLLKPANRNKIGKGFLRATEVALSVAGAYEMSRKLLQETQERFMNSVVVNGTENRNVYPLLMDWVTTAAAGSRRLRMVTNETMSSRTEPGSANLWIESNTSHKVKLNGHVVHIEVTVPSDSKGRMASWSPMGMSWNASVTLSTYTKEGNKAVLELLDELSRKSRTQTSSVFISSDYEWKPSGRPVRRMMDTVVLPETVKDSLLQDIDHFLESEQFYLDHGMPWHRGYLLYGPPGTGKSSVTEAIATHTTCSIALLSLATVESDSVLYDLVSEVPKNSVLVIEDVDTVKSSEKRKEEDESKSSQNAGVTLGGLLNVLDGLMTPHGLIVIMTTNHRDKLDPALIRSGRVDYEVHLDYMSQEQFANMYAAFGGVGDAPVLKRKNVAPSQVVEAFKSSKGNREDFEKKMNLLANKS